MSVKIKIFLFMLLFMPQLAQAFSWGECPFDRVAEPYPGICGRYRDLDNDAICDLSQTNPESRGLKEPLNSPELAYQDKYNFILITVIILFTFGVLEYLAYAHKKYSDQYLKYFTDANLRWFWNIILLWSFIVVFLTSLLNLAQLYNLIGPTQVNYSFWHIEAGIVMLVVSVVHIIRRWRSFVR